MSSTNGEEQPLKKTKPWIESNSISSLPDDLIVSFLARVSRYHYPIISLVSKSFRSLLASPELYQTRTFLNRTEACLCVCLEFPCNPNPQWFILHKKPNETLPKKKKKEERSSGYVLAPIQNLNSPSVEWSNLIAVGSNIYAISETFKDAAPSSNISYLDCRSHTWLQAPSMRFAHTDRDLDGKLYLPGSCENPDSLNCIEVFNTNTQTWKPVPHGERVFNLKNMQGKIVVNLVDIGGFAFSPKESTLKPVLLDMYSLENSDRDCFCVIETIPYYYVFTIGFRWFDSNLEAGKELKGLEEGLPHIDSCSEVKLVDDGGNMIVLWDTYVSDRERR